VTARGVGGSRVVSPAAACASYFSSILRRWEGLDFGTASAGKPAKQVAIDVLRDAGEPLHAKEIAKRVLDSGRARLSGKTPEQTITAMLAVGSKPGGPFARVDKGTYTLANAAVEPQKPSRRPKSQPTQERHTAKPAQ
jgi:HB1, ASXL, restriction endonuclease HTH domain